MFQLLVSKFNEPHDENTPIVTVPFRDTFKVCIHGNSESSWFVVHNTTTQIENYVVNSTHDPSDIKSVLERIKKDGFVGDDGFFYIDKDYYLYVQLSCFMNTDIPVEPVVLEPIDIIDNPKPRRRVMPPAVQERATTLYQKYQAIGDCRGLFTTPLNEKTYEMVCMVMNHFKGAKATDRAIKAELHIGSSDAHICKGHYTTLLYALETKTI